MFRLFRVCGVFSVCGVCVVRWGEQGREAMASLSLFWKNVRDADIAVGVPSPVWGTATMVVSRKRLPAVESVYVCVCACHVCV